LPGACVWEGFFPGGEAIVYFSGGGRKHFSRGPTVVKFYFTHSKLREKHFSTKNVNRKISHFKIQAGPRPPSNAHGQAWNRNSELAFLTLQVF